MEPELVQEILKSVRMTIIVLLTLPIILNNGQKLWSWKRMGALLLFLGHLALALSPILFISYIEIEVINWVIRLGVTLLLAGVVSSTEFKMLSLKSFLKTKSAPKFKDEYEEEVHKMVIFLDILKKNNKEIKNG